MVFYTFLRLILHFKEKKTRQMEELRFDSFDSKSGAFPAAPRCLPKAARAFAGSSLTLQLRMFSFHQARKLISSTPSHFHKGKFPWPSMDLLFLVFPWITLLPRPFSTCRLTVTNHSHISSQLELRLVPCPSNTGGMHCLRAARGSFQAHLYREHVPSRVILPPQ